MGVSRVKRRMDGKIRADMFAWERKRRRENRRQEEGRWGKRGRRRVINQLKNASALFKLRTEGTDRVDRITGDKKRRIENGRQDEKR